MATVLPFLSLVPGYHSGVSRHNRRPNQEGTTMARNDPHGATTADAAAEHTTTRR